MSHSTHPTRIGIDLDNTLVDYQRAYFVLAEKFGVSTGESPRDDVRRALRRNPPDDTKWQEFQSLLYTDGLRFASPAPGVLRFLLRCRLRGVGVIIVSHKSEATPRRFGGIDLRTPAREWLRKHQIIPSLIGESSVIFCDSQEEKVKKILDLELDVFVDDLPEVVEQIRTARGPEAVLYSREPDDPSGMDFFKLTDYVG